jgi:hypothetical protein
MQTVNRVSVFEGVSHSIPTQWIIIIIIIIIIISS